MNLSVIKKVTKLFLSHNQKVSLTVLNSFYPSYLLFLTCIDESSTCPFPSSDPPCIIKSGIVLWKFFPL